MEKYVVVKQKHLYNGDRNLMFKGSAFFSQKDDCLVLSYKEKDQKTEVRVEAKKEQLCIERKGEIITHLTFRPKEVTKGSILSVYGTMEIDVFTHKYIKKENIIAIEYDIRSGEETVEGYRIIWSMKEDQA